jgi:fimbrial chaperone protein
VKPHEPIDLLRHIVAAYGALSLTFAPPAVNAAGSLTVLPVNIQLAPGQMATALTVINQGDVGTAFQIRAFAWTQSNDGIDRLQPTTTLLASPPLGTIAPGATQVVRMVLRHPPQGQEATYRILIDQIPPPAAPGVVSVALRLSIPIFAEPTTRVAPDVQWHVQYSAGQAFLIATNDGTHHETVRDITLSDASGHVYKVEANVSPYILIGSTRRWRIVSAPPVPGVALRLNANTDTGRIDQSVRVVGAR